MIMVYFEREGCAQQNLYLNCVSRYKKVLKTSYGTASSACNRNRTFCFTGVSYMAQLLWPISA